MTNTQMTQEQIKAMNAQRYQQERQKYGIFNGLFRCTAIADNGTQVIYRNGQPVTQQKFGYFIVPVNEKNEAGLHTGTFFWANELIDITQSTEKLIESRRRFKARLDGSEKSILMSIDLKYTTKNGRAYWNVNRLWEQFRKGQNPYKQQAQAVLAQQVPAGNTVVPAPTPQYQPVAQQQVAQPAQVQAQPEVQNAVPAPHANYQELPFA